MADLDLLTLTEAKQALNLSGATNYDTELPAWITATSVLLDSKVGPIVKREVTDEVHDGGNPWIRTRLYPVAEFISVTEYSGLTATALTVETNLAHPSAGYRAEAYVPSPGLYSGRLVRRSGGYGAVYPSGSGNVVVSYVAGRFEDTASVDERFKAAARLTLQSLWNSQRPNLAQVGEFEIPQSNWPRFAVPNAVREMFTPGEWIVGVLVA